MKVSYRWLKDYCDFDLSAEELARQLSLRGLAVEGVAPVGDDFCIELEITANRPDLLSHIGVAREIAGLTGSVLRIPDVPLTEETRLVTQIARVEVQNPELCPRYTARVLYDVKVAPAPAEMRRRLEVIGVRPVNNVVDITNYVLMECGQPEHAFDLGRLRGGAVVIRQAEAGEVLELIDGTEVRLSPEHLVIADVARPVALAGVMGGLATEIGDGTRVVLLESAKFDPISIRRTARSTGKASDSSYRFERGVDTPTVEWASRRAAALMQQHAGAKLAAGVIDVNLTREMPRTITLRIPRVERVLGLPIGAPEAGKLLKGIGLGVKLEGHDSLTVAVPSFRPDIEQEIDLIEEVARCHGYDRVPETARLVVTDVPVSKTDHVVARARETLVRLGYCEAVTTSFLADKLAQAFSPWDSEEPIRVSNPLRSDEAALRRSLVPSLLQVARTNQAQGVGEVHIFEVDRVYLRRSKGHRLPDEKRCLAILAHADFRDVRGAAEAVLDRLGVLRGVAFGPASQPFLTPGAAGAWHLGSGLLGYIGEVSDEAAAAFDLRRAPHVAELDLDLLAGAASLDKTFRALPRFPAVGRDVAIVVREATTWADILGVVEAAAAEYIESVSFGEVYRGKQIEAGRKGVFFGITYRAPDRTLTNDEVNASQARIVAALAEHLGATLRT
ncbi:MAG TPA: phenylalanine--tRNA ligase subunit beta [Planctomycetota bacterium]|nr:phenylalanine--tRNA ligase subunit beta [Planctomycetota bacterium]